MPTQADVRRIALSFPEAIEERGRFAFSVAGKDFAWVWLERVDPKKPRIPNPEVIAVRVAGDVDKQVLLAMDREVFFTEPHYDGYPAVLVRLPNIDRALLRKVLREAWACRAPRELGGLGPATRSRSPAPPRRPAGAARRARPAPRRRA
jgi:hypothetical protein